MKKFSKIFLVCLTFFLASMALLSCARKNVTVYLYDEDGTLLDKQTFLSQIKYEIPEGLIVAPEEIAEELQYYDYQLLTKDGKVFDSTVDTVDEDIELHVKWGLKKFRISFEPNGGLEIGSIEVQAKSSSGELPQTLRDGCIFKGWYVEEELVNLFDTTQPVLHDYKLYAKWELIPEEERATVTYEMGFDDIVARQTIRKGTVLEKPQDPKRDGYAFKGWFNGEAAYDFTQVVNEDLTLTAKWEAIKYSVTFEVTNAKVMDAIKNVEITEALSIAEGTLIHVNNLNYLVIGDGLGDDIWISFVPEKGYKLDKLQLKDGSALPNHVNTDLVIVPVFAEITYDVSFEANGGTGTMRSVTAKEGNYPLPECGFTAPEGKRFAGWALSEDGEKITDEAINLTENTTLYALWEEIPVEYRDAKIYLGIMGETGIAKGELLTTVHQQKGTQVTLKAPAKEGYTFISFFATNGRWLDPTLTLNEDVEVLALYVRSSLALTDATTDGFKSDYPISGGKVTFANSITFNEEAASKYVSFEVFGKARVTINFDLSIKTTTDASKKAQLAVYKNEADENPILSDELTKDNLSITNGQITVDITNNTTIYLGRKGGTGLTLQNLTVSIEYAQPTILEIKRGEQYTPVYAHSGQTLAQALAGKQSELDRYVYTYKTEDGQAVDLSQQVTGHLVLVEEKQEIKYTVIYKEGETVLKTDENFTASSELYNPNKEGYDLIGWSITKDGKKVDILNAKAAIENMENKQITLTGEFSRKIEIALKLYETDTTPYYVIRTNVTRGIYPELIKDYTAPTTVVGKEFSGWVVGDKLITNLVDFAPLIKDDSQNMTFVASFTPLHLHADFHTGEGYFKNKTNVRTVDVDYGSALINADKYEEPKRPGYDFAGWYVDAALTTQYDLTTPVTVAVDLYAKWEKKADAEFITVTLDLSGGSYNGSTENVVVNDVAKGSNYNLYNISQVLVKEGFDLVGWFIGDAEYEENTVLNENTTIKAKWAVKQLNYTFVAGGEEPYAAGKIEYGQKLTKPEKDPVKEGYFFLYWEISSGEGSREYDFNTPVTNDIGLRAKFVSMYETGVFTSATEEALAAGFVPLDGSNFISAKADCDKVIVEEEKEYYNFAGDADKTVQRLRIKKSTADKNVILVDLTKYTNVSVALYIWAKNPSATSERHVFVSQDGVVNTQNKTLLTNSVESYRFELEGGHKYYIGASGDNIDIYAVSIAKNVQYTVTYDNKGLGEAPASVQNVLALPETLPTLSDNNAIFKGWAILDGDKEPSAQAGQKIYKNTTLYAIWVMKPYVSFDPNGGTGDMEPAIIVPGTYTLPTTCGFTAPAGKEFDGWALEATGAKITTATIEVTDNITLYAVWKDLATFDVTFNLGYEGATGAPEKQAVVAGQPAQKPTDPTRAGYKFLGWFEANADAAFNFETPITAAVSLTAKWEQKTADYVVKHFKQNADGTYPEEPTDTDNLNAVLGKVTPQTKTYVGFTAPQAQEFEVTENGQNIFVYQYTRNAYTVAFDKNAEAATGEMANLTNVKFEAQLNIQNSFAAPQGKKFVGWALTATGNQLPAADLETLGEALVNAAQEGTITLYALWADLDSYTITWSIEGVESTTTVNAGVVPTHDAPTKEGTAQFTYTFKGWSTAAEGEVLEALPQATANAKYYAIFEATVNKYTVSITVSEAGYGTVSQATVAEVAYGTVIAVSNNTLTIGQTVCTATPAEATAQYTYSFAKWTSGNEVLVESKTVEGNLTILAEFARATNKYTVTFVDEDGTTVLLAAKEYEYGTAVDSIEVPNNPTKAATAQYTYTFAGWTPELGQVVENAVYKATYNQQLNKVVVKYNVNGELVAEENWSTIDYGTGFDGTNNVLYTISRTGYVFSGWYIDENLTTEYEYLEQDNEVVKGAITTNPYILYAKLEGSSALYVFSAGQDDAITKHINELNSTSSDGILTIAEGTDGKGGFTDLEKEYDGISFTKVYATGGQSKSNTKNYIKLNLAQIGGKALVTIYGISGAASQSRTGGLCSALPISNDNKVASFTNDGNNPGSVTVVVSCDKDYYIGSFGSNFYFLGVKVTFAEDFYEVNLKNVTGNNKLYVKPGETPSIIDPTKTGHTFNGWFTDSELENAYKPAALTSNLDLYAKWTANTYTITLNANDGEIAQGKDVTTYTYGVGATLPTNSEITKAGHRFDGWFDNEGFTGDAVTAITVEDLGNKEYFAKWTAVYNVTFDENGHGTKPNDLLGLTEINVSELPQLEDEGWIFGGWKLNDTLLTENTNLTANVTLVAVWSEVTNVYTVTLHTNGGTIADGKNVTSYNEGASKTLPAAEEISKEGYGFAGWYVDIEFNGDAVTEISASDKGDKEFYAKWDKLYTISFNANGHGNTPNAIIDVKIVYANLPTNDDNNWAFKGWKLNDELVTEDKTINNDVTLVASWVAKAPALDEYNFKNFEVAAGITTDKAYGVFTLSKGVHSQFREQVGYVSLYKGNTVTFEVESNGSVFMLSYNGNNSNRFLTLTSSNNQYTATKKYTNGTYMQSIESYTFGGQSFTIETAPKGWIIFEGLYAGTYTITFDTDESESIIGKGEEKIERMKLFQMKEASQYAVSFDANGGTGTMAAVQAGWNYTLPACTFTAPQGKEFDGWALAANGEKITTETINVTANTTLFALWKDEVQKFTVSFDANGGSGTMNAVQVEAGSYTLPACTFTAPDGKEFDGWATTANGDKITTETTNVSANTTLYAKWTEASSEPSVTIIGFVNEKTPLSEYISNFGKNTSGYTDGIVTYSDTNKSPKLFVTGGGSSNVTGRDINDNDFDYTDYAQFGGKTASSRYIKIVVEENMTATIFVVFINTKDGETRTLFLSNSATDTVPDNLDDSYKQPLDKGTLGYLKITGLTAGTYYLNATGDLGIYALQIVY